MDAYLNRVATVVPRHDVHARFVEFAGELLEGTRGRPLFDRMATRSGIEHRWSVLGEEDARLDEGIGFYGGEPPTTAARMAIYAREAPALALKAIAGLPELGEPTHLVVASCTGFVAPGIDQIIARRLGLADTIERVLIGFMGCYAAIVALRASRHIVRSEPDARVLVVTVELSSLHLQDETAIEPLLAMLQFGDGAAAGIVSAEPTGIELGQPFAATLGDSAELIRWTITDTGFAMHLDGAVPGRIGDALGDADFVATVTGGAVPADLFAQGAAAVPAASSVMRSAE